MDSKCRDCGKTLDSWKETLVKRDDVCDECGERRDALVHAMESGQIEPNLPEDSTNDGRRTRRG
jgi:DNA-directed RNA polymerase subunit RPC12/RpoP